MADGATERAGYFALVCTGKPKSVRRLAAEATCGFVNASSHGAS